MTGLVQYVGNSERLLYSFELTCAKAGAGRWSKDKSLVDTALQPYLDLFP